MLTKLRALLARLNPDAVLSLGILVATAMLLLIATYLWQSYQHRQPVRGQRLPNSQAPSGGAPATKRTQLLRSEE